MFTRFNPVILGLACFCVVESMLLHALSTSFNSERDVILGSGSPRRKEILSGLLGLSFRVMKSDFEENLPKNIDAASYCLATANQKASDLMKRKLAGTLKSGEKRRILICADTVVDLEGSILEKPMDAEHSFRMLKSLAGRQHQVHSAVIICGENPEGTGGLRKVSDFVGTTTVQFTALSDDDIRAYIATGEGDDKAGSYAIQGCGGQLVERIEGCFQTVVGLPAHTLSKELSRLYRENLI